MTHSYKHLHELKAVALPLIENQLDTWLTLSHGPQQGLFEAARYSTLGIGKRFRPLLTLAVTTQHNIPFEQAVQAASIIELIHTYSLIHDDLPCMDNDDFRRGKKSLHKVVGEGLALLTGDFLLTFAFQKLSEITSIDPLVRLRLITALASAAGHQGMVGGQYADLTSHQHPQTREFVQWMHEHKTGSLMRVCMEFGAILSGLSSEQISHWRRFGQQFGLLFQLVDDLLDSLPCNMKGAPIGPSSYITFAGVQKTLDEVRQLKEQLLITCHQLDPHRQILSEMVEAVTRQYEDLPQIASSANT